MHPPTHTPVQITQMVKGHSDTGFNFISVASPLNYIAKKQWDITFVDLNFLDTMESNSFFICYVTSKYTHVYLHGIWLYN